MKTMKIAFGLLTIILKRMSESVFFQSNKFTACKVGDETEVANYLVAFSLLKVIYPIPGKKYLRTW